MDTLQIGSFQLDPVQRQLTISHGNIVKLTNLEFRLLHLLMSHQNKVLEPNYIVECVWGYSGDGDNVLLKNVVYRLRRKIETDSSQPRYLRTVTGKGYVFQSD
ncbi:MAG: response regulator transcription factor [Ardenticatenaceae bacterium]|nr:response regulator transcription factor [Ardenticatenaceae bacterium]